MLKWVGNKTNMKHKLKLLIDKSKTDIFIDAFCGSMSVPYKLNLTAVILNDINSNLIHFYNTVKNSLDELITILDTLKDKNNRKDYENLRDEYNTDECMGVRRAAIFLYLNKRCYNGIYRENKSGKFNVPYREYKTSLYDINELQELSKYLNSSVIYLYNENFFDFIERIKLLKHKNILVYIDPPYYVSETSSFTSYSKTPFNIEEQQMLKEKCDELTSLGIKFIMSNAPCNEIIELYSEYNQEQFFIPRKMRSSKQRPSITNTNNNEILIYNF